VDHVELPGDAAADGLAAYGEVVEREEQRVTLRVPRERAPERTAELVRDLRGCLLDLTLEDPPIEEVIDRVFASEAIDPTEPRLPELARSTATLGSDD
jgi:ABC-2 type transport system ATP-binding protein